LNPVVIANATGKLAALEIEGTVESVTAVKTKNVKRIIVKILKTLK
jgi:hypothetical protein